MSWILNFIPSWIYWLLLIAGLSGYFLSDFFPLKSYSLLLKIIGAILVCVIIFIFGLDYSNQQWQARVDELQAKVATAEAKSQQVNEIIKERVVFKTQLIKQRGENTVEYMTREVTPHDSACVIPKEFIRAHNSAAELPK